MLTKMLPRALILVEFDAIFGRIKQRRIPVWADPMRQRQNEINTSDGGRGVYFQAEDPSVGD